MSDFNFETEFQAAVQRFEKELIRLMDIYSFHEMEINIHKPFLSVPAKVKVKVSRDYVFAEELP